MLVGALLIVGCRQDNNTSSVQEDKKDVREVSVKEDLFTNKGKEFLKVAIKDELDTLSDDGEVQITEYFPVYTAEKITSDYDKNEIRANNLYKDKQFFVTGRIGSIEAAMDDKPVVNLKTQANYGFNSPLLRFSKIDQAKVADLDKGEKVTFLCTGKSEIAGTPILENCMFLETFEKQIFDDALNFEDQDLKKGNSQYNKAVFMYVASTLAFGKASNDFADFESCTVVDSTCIAKIAKTVSKDDINKVINDVKAQFPKATESLKETTSEK